MTISRSDLIDPARLVYQFLSSNDPGTIGVEVSLEGNVLIDVSMNAEGEASVLFDTDGGQFEFDVEGFRSVLDKCEAELSAWRERLVQPGEMWERSA